MRRAIRSGLDRCRICSGVAVTAARFSEQCATAIDAGDREALADRAVAQIVSRHRPLGGDMERLRAAAIRGHLRRFADGGAAPGPLRPRDTE